MNEDEQAEKICAFAWTAEGGMATVIAEALRAARREEREACARAVELGPGTRVLDLAGSVVGVCKENDSFCLKCSGDGSLFDEFGSEVGICWACNGTGKIACQLRFTAAQEREACAARIRARLALPYKPPLPLGINYARTESRACRAGTPNAEPGDDVQNGADLLTLLDAFARNP